MRVLAREVVPDRFTSPVRARWLIRALLAISAFAIALDITIASSLGSGGTGSILSSFVLGAPLVVAAILHFAREGRIQAAQAPLLALVAYVAWSIASVFWTTGDQGEVVTRALTNAQLLLFVWLFAQVVRDHGEVRALMAGYVFGCVALVGLTWRNYLAGIFAFWGRYAADGFDPNEMAVYLALGLPMAAYLALAGDARGRKLALLYVPVAFTGVVLSGSRGGLLAAVAATAAIGIWLARRSWTGSALALALLAVGIAFASVAIPAESWSRIFSVGDELGAGTAGDRKQIWRAGLAVFERHPVIGVGAGGFLDAVVPAVHLRIVAHNTPLEIAVELGVIGVILFFGVAVLVLWGVRRCGPHDRAVVWALMVTWLVGVQSLSWEYRKPTWFAFLLGIAIAAVRARPEARGSR